MDPHKGEKIWGEIHRFLWKCPLSFFIWLCWWKSIMDDARIDYGLAGECL